MPRGSRKNAKSFCGVYHIILRGINNQDIFFDDMDKKNFIKRIISTKQKYNYELYAYVLMSNHVHLLIKDKNDSISKIMQSLATSYAIYFNKKYDRIGHLFYNRFHSKCVENLAYLLNLQRYIHKNPQKDGICKMDKYKWSSYQEYLNKGNITDIDFILNIFDSKDRKKAIELWKNYNLIMTNEIENDSKFEIGKKLSDNEAIEKIKTKLKIDNILEIQKYNVKYRKQIISKIACIEGIRRKQLARIIGISERTIYRIINEKIEECP